MTLASPRRASEPPPRPPRPSSKAWSERLGAWLRSVLRQRRTWVIDGVRYKERTRVPLRRALGRHGEGEKVYDVRFPGPEAPAPMAIHATRDRVFADLAPCDRANGIAALRALVRPGWRVFEYACATGGGSVALSELVGPSGGVVSAGQDRESIRFARRRYRRSNLGFEMGGAETLDGETDGAFDAVIAHLAPAEDEALRELWRVVAPGGLLACRTTPSGAEPAGERTVEMRVRLACRDAQIDAASTPDLSLRWVLARRPGESEA
ncbi:MAG: class I SAM-dependent methyltransferase [Phycisphaerales bacterium JB059]